MATHSSILAWKIPWTEEPGTVQSMASQRVGTTERLHLISNKESCESQPLNSSWTESPNRRRAQGTESGAAHKRSQCRQPLQR